MKTRTMTTTGEHLKGLLVCVALVTCVAARRTSPEAEVTSTEVNTRTKHDSGRGGGGGAGGGAGGGGGATSRAHAPVRIAALESNLLLMRQFSPGGDIFAGYLADLVREISKTAPHHKFEWMVDEEEDERTSLTKLIGKLTSGKTDVIVLPLNSATTSHSRRLSQSRPFLRTTLSLLLKAPPSTSPTRPWFIEDLLNNTNGSSRLEFGVTNEMIAKQLQMSNASLYHQLWNDKAPSQVVLSQEEGLRRVREGNTALLMESTEATYLSSTEPCDLLALDQFTHEASYVFALMRNRSSLLSDLDRILAQLGGVNFFGELFRKWWGSDECTTRPEVDDDDHDYRHLDLERIFFTSPIKFFKNTIKPFVPDAPSTTASNRLPPSTTNHGLDLGRVTRGQGHPDSSFALGHTSTTHRRRSKTTSGPEGPALATQGHHIRVLTEPNHEQKSARRSRVSRKPSTTPMPRVLQGDGYSYPVLDMPPPTLSGEVDKVQRSEEDPSGDQDTPPMSVKTTTPAKRRFDFEWFFVTQEPRISDESNYDLELEELDDYDDGTEQRDVVKAMDSGVKVKGTTPRSRPLSPAIRQDTSTANPITIPMMRLVVAASALLTILNYSTRIS